MNIRKSILFFCLLCMLCFLFSGCVSLTKRMEIQSAGNDDDYPPSEIDNPSFFKDQPGVDLSEYQSVESTAGRPYQNPKVAIAIAASGGGYRAANLTAGVLMGLESIQTQYQNSNLLQQVDYFSTVSGGGFAVGSYISSLYNYYHTHGGSDGKDFRYADVVDAMVNKHASSHQPDVLDTDMTDLFFAGPQRGQMFEERLNKTVLHLNQGVLKLKDIFIPKEGSPADVKYPYWLANASIFQNAAIFPFAPDVLEKYRISGYIHHYKPYCISDSEKQEEFDYNMPYSVGVAASATYPFIMPAVPLESYACKGGCFLQLLDGGLTDNLGVFTAMRLLAQDPAPVKVLIVVDAFRGTSIPFSKNYAPPGTLDLLWRILNMSVDSDRARIKPNLQTMARAALCRAGTSNVLLIYLDLEQNPEIKAIGTSLYITHMQQRRLINAGHNLVRNNLMISKTLVALINGQRNIAPC